MAAMMPIGNSFSSGSGDCVGEIVTVTPAELGKADPKALVRAELAARVGNDTVAPSVVFTSGGAEPAGVVTVKSTIREPDLTSVTATVLDATPSAVAISAAKLLLNQPKRVELPMILSAFALLIALIVSTAVVDFELALTCEGLPELVVDGVHVIVLLTSHV
jgi:hypothetical protein